MGDLSQNFSRWEFSCKCGCGFAIVDTELIDRLEELRVVFGEPITITSGCRCKGHNAVTVGAAENSQHLLGWAADFRVRDIHEDQVADYLEERYPQQYGIGRYIGRTHLDMRNTVHRWDKR